MKKPRILVLNPPLKLREVQKKLNSSVRLIRGNYKDIEVIIVNKSVRILHKKKDMRRFDFVWISGSWSKRDIAKSISLYLSHYSCAHTLVEEGSGSSKLVDMVLFALGELPQPRSYYCISSEYSKRLNEIEIVCQFPLIAKDTRGTFGKHSFLARNSKELKRKLFQIPENIDFVFQEYIPNDFDWGIIIGGGKLLSAEKSFRNKNSESFMNHAAGGATEVFLPLEKVPEKVVTIAKQANTLLSLAWSRSDILISSQTGKAYILETNRSPRMTSNSMEVDAFAAYINSFLRAQSLDK
ncbi:MAG: hypothetical protein QY312_04355 [Candidatus Dojkabacteria bacterium]|nr:MAG: hypothetical protein QY312_04355 [Candidatus Dojkabacteria bacterium]